MISKLEEEFVLPNSKYNFPYSSILMVIFNKNIEDIGNINNVISFSCTLMTSDNITEENSFLTIKTGDSEFDYKILLNSTEPCLLRQY